MVLGRNDGFLRKRWSDWRSSDGGLGGMDNSLQRESMKRVEKKRGFCNFDESSERVYEERSRYHERKS